MALLVGLAVLVMAGAPSRAAAPVAAAGQLIAFGDNFSGALGSTINNGTVIANPTPAPVSLPGASGPVTQIAAGEQHTLALTSTGQLYAFGDNTAGQLGVATNSGITAANPTPTLVSVPGATGPVTQIAAGGYHSLALTSTGQLFAFGDNFGGELGNTTNNASLTANPTPTLVSLPGATGPVTQMAAGGFHSLALTSTGQLFAFGDNSYGQLGNTSFNGGFTANPTPTLVSLPGASGPVTLIAAGEEHSLAVTSTGQLYAFGDNNSGQLGSPTDSGTLAANPTPTLVSLPGAGGPVTQVAAGYAHSLAVTSTGQLYAFGDDSTGELGNATNSGTATPNPAPTLVSLPGASGTVTQIAAGYGYSLVVTSSGQLYAFGDNTAGELGGAASSGTATANPTPTLVSLPAGTTIDTVARGPDAMRTLALVADLGVATRSLPPARIGVGYSTTAQGSGGAAPYRWSASGLPAGLSIDPTSGQITGTPTVPGRVNVVLTLADADGITATSPTLPLKVARATPPAPTAAQLKASLRVQLLPSGRAAKIATLLQRNGYVVSFAALRPGVVVIDWYRVPKCAQPAARKAKPVLVGAGKRRFAAAGTLPITIRLTTKGRQLLANATRIRLTARGAFSATGTSAVVAIRRFTLAR